MGIYDIEIYFDNKIRIAKPKDYVVKTQKPKVVSESNSGYGNNKYKYNILKVIEKRNQEEEAIAELIEDFENKINAFPHFIKADKMGKRLISKIKDYGSAFSKDEIYNDINKLNRKHTIINKNLNDFFIKETKETINQICDDFEKEIKK